MSAVISLPTYWQPGWSSSPSLGRPKVTVASALTHTPDTSVASVDAGGYVYCKDRPVRIIDLVDYLGCESRDVLPRPVPNRPSSMRSIDRSNANSSVPFSVSSVISKPISRISIFRHRRTGCFSPIRYTLMTPLCCGQPCCRRIAAVVALPATIVTAFRRIRQHGLASAATAAAAFSITYTGDAVPFIAHSSIFSFVPALRPSFLSLSLMLLCS